MVTPVTVAIGDPLPSATSLTTVTAVSTPVSTVVVTETDAMTRHAKDSVSLSEEGACK